MPNLAGGKYAHRHSSVTMTAFRPIKAAAALICVNKIALGVITPIGNGPVLIKFMDESPTCLLAKVRGPRSIQEIRIYTSDKEAVQQAMQKAL